jgi:hypothetical protein
MTKNLRVGVVLLAASLLGLTGAAAAHSANRAAKRSVLVVKVRLGDLCSHDTVPPSPKCAPQPLAGARLRLVDANERPVSAGKSGADGKVRLRAQAGKYTLVAKAVSGVRITPEPQAVTLARGMKRSFVLTYFTGIQ